MATQGTASAGSGAGRSCTDLLEWFIVCTCHVDFVILTLPWGTRLCQGTSHTRTRRFPPGCGHTYTLLLLFNGHLGSASTPTWLTVPLVASKRTRPNQWLRYQRRIMIKPEAQTKAERVWPLEAVFLSLFYTTPCCEGRAPCPSPALLPPCLLGDHGVGTTNPKWWRVMRGPHVSPAMECLGTVHFGRTGIKAMGLNQ